MVRVVPIPGGLDQLNDFGAPIHPALFSAAAAAAASSVYMIRHRVSAPFTVTSVRVYCNAAASGNFTAGIYTSDGTTWTRAATSAESAATATTLHTATLSAPYVLVPGVDYWLAMGSDSATPTWARLAGVNAAMLAVANVALVKGAVYSAGLPATITTPTGSTYIPFIGVS